MKTILALLIIGAAYATALGKCPKDDYVRCFGYIPGSEDDAFRQTEEFLDSTCAQFRCAIGYEKACGLPDDQPATVSSFKHYKKIYNALCENYSSIRRKYLENVSCLNRVTKSMGDKCQIKERQGPHDPKYCRSIEDYLDCISDFVRDGCGKEAGEVYDAVAPNKELFGC